MRLLKPLRPDSKKLDDPDRPQRSAPGDDLWKPRGKVHQDIESVTEEP